MHFVVDHVVPLDLPFELKTNKASLIGKPDALSLWAESNTKLTREKQGALIVAIYLPTKLLSTNHKGVSDE